MNYVAIDLGAESGRVIVGLLQDGRVDLEEVHRFPNHVIRAGDSIQWDMDNLLREVLLGVSKASAYQVASMSADSWGVDYILIGASGPTFHYRDPRTARGVKEILARVPRETVFAETGIQFMPINTLFQLAAEDPNRLLQASSLLSVADYVNRILGGQEVIEESMASTFQLYNPRTRSWSKILVQALGLFQSFLPKVAPSGTVIGDLKASIQRPFFPNQAIKIIATCSHDTGAAVAAVPADGSVNWAYLSSGTWSLMGIERVEPIMNDLARELNFTNEIGYDGSIRLLKNISGLWLLQECRRIWGKFDYGELTTLAAGEKPFQTLINPMDARFLAPENMPAEIAAYCRETGQAVPASPAAFTRCILESLALLYRKTLLQLEQLAGAKIEILHVVGGGSKNALLNQFTADACQIPVRAGPVEATALGNVMIQAITMGEIPNLSAARALIRQNFGLQTFEPREAVAWMDAFARFRQLAGSS